MEFKKIEPFLVYFEYSDGTQYAIFCEGTSKEDVKDRLEKKIKDSKVMKVRHIHAK